MQATLTDVMRCTNPMLQGVKKTEQLLPFGPPRIIREGFTEDVVFEMANADEQDFRAFLSMLLQIVQSLIKSDPPILQNLTLMKILTKLTTIILLV